MLLTATQLFDLAFDLIKAKKQPTQTGPRGGRFYLTQSGEKVYGEGKVETPNTLAHVVSAPHQSASHEDVEVQIIPGRKEPASMRQKMMIKPPKSMADKQSRRAYIQEYSRGNWPAYFCRNCKAAIIPNHDHPVTENREVEDLRTGEKTNIPETVGHTTLVTQMHTVGEKSGQKEQIEPPDPAAVAQRLCPTCFGQHEVLSREVGGRFKKEKPTKESKAKSRELKAMARQLKVALKKPDRERSPGEQSMVREHEAIQRVRERAEADRIKAEGPSFTERREKEAARFEKEEADAMAKLREQFKDHLVRQGMDEHEAESASHSLTDKDIHEYRQERSRAASIRREETSKRLSQELAGKKIARVIGMGDLMDLYARRADGGVAREHAATVEGLHPSLAREEEEVRTRRLRERKEEMERAKPKKKVKKSLELWVSL